MRQNELMRRGTTLPGSAGHRGICGIRNGGLLLALAAIASLSACGSDEVPGASAAKLAAVTSDAPATAVPSTTPPTAPPTAAPTTVRPTTVAPTTAVSTTTVEPTTTNAPTTLGPTTVVTIPAAVPPTPAPPPPPRAQETYVELGTIEIPKLRIVKTLLEGISLNTLDLAPGHWPGTAMPGQVGNTVIAGHRTSHDKPFRNIDQLVAGDEVIFTTADGRFVYQVTGVSVVKPDALYIIDQTATATATLFACHPPGSTRQRIVVSLALVQ